jgi:hypothetical protein
VAKQRVSSEIDERLHGQTVPTLVAEFLQQHWQLVLIQAFTGPDDGGDRWEAAIRTMDDLLWSVRPKQGSAERDRLLATLPELLQRLQHGLESVDLGDAWDPFFAKLIRIHVGAFHNEAPRDSYAPPDSESNNPSAPPRPSMQTMRSLAMVDASPDIEPHAPQTPPVSAAPAESPEDRHLERAKSLEVGAWVEFEGLRGTKKTLRLSWVSEFRGVYLFTNRQGENSLTLATTSLAEHLRKGTARVLSRERLTDRAVAQLLDHRVSQVLPADARGPSTLA